LVGGSQGLANGLSRLAGRGEPVRVGRCRDAAAHGDTEHAPRLRALSLIADPIPSFGGGSAAMTDWVAEGISSANPVVMTTIATA
jgi:hypothetical protein